MGKGGCARAVKLPLVLLDRASNHLGGRCPRFLLPWLKLPLLHPFMTQAQAQIYHTTLLKFPSIFYPMLIRIDPRTFTNISHWHVCGEIFALGSTRDLAIGVHLAYRSHPAMCAHLISVPLSDTPVPTQMNMLLSPVTNDHCLFSDVSPRCYISHIAKHIPNISPNAWLSTSHPAMTAKPKEAITAPLQFSAVSVIAMTPP